MKTNILKLSLFCLLATLVWSCSKTDTQQHAGKKELPENILKKLKEQGSTISIPVNAHSKGYLTDADGNLLQQPGGIRPKTETTDPVYCDDPFAAEPADVQLTSIDKRFDCSSGFKLTVNWEISTVFTLVTTNPDNGSQLSRGRIKLLNVNNQTLYQNLSITSLDIEALGVDPSNPEKTRYRVSYTTPYIDRATMSGVATISASYVVYTDCGGGIAESNPYTNVFGLVNEVSTNPCTRVDKISIVPVSIAPGYKGYIAGSDVPGNCYGYGYVHNSGSIIEYKPLGSTSYRLLMFDAPDGGQTREGKLYYWEVANFYLSPGTYVFRYKNFMEGAGACIGAPHSVEEVITIQ